MRHNDFVNDRHYNRLLVHILGTYFGSLAYSTTNSPTDHPKFDPIDPFGPPIDPFDPLAPPIGPIGPHF